MQKKIKHVFHHHVKPLTRIIFWFSLGGILGFFFFVSFVYIFYLQNYRNLIYPGVIINNVDFSGKSQAQIRSYFDDQNSRIASLRFVWKYKNQVASISATELQAGFDTNLLTQQAYSVGRSNDITANASLLFQAYIDNVRLSPAYTYNDTIFDSLIAPLQKQINKNPVNASFVFSGDRVKTFTLSQDGQRVDMDALKQQLLQTIPLLFSSSRPQTVVFTLPVATIQPSVTDDSFNKYGIKELISSGTSLFAGSTDSRVYNIGLAASRLNGVLVPPNTVFSFDQSVGDISSLSGYKQAYIISNGHTILGDGGGVCQVSTTMFRAILNAGLPVVERHAHAYRVHYYEEDSPVGIDAAIYSPTVDLKFKNDTGHYILIQSVFDPDNLRLTFNFYGTKDGRQVTINQPVILSQTPAPAPLYQDDPDLPKGTLQQTDFAADGADVYFTRTVTQNGKVIISDKFVSNFQPWQAVYLRGTK
ncbi:MAG TPA: VanW family protein [Patescibacteria group bacterium]|nr:VanW family protein [Patescibacteria group bacterium]